MFQKIKNLLGRSPEPEADETPAVGATDRYSPHLPILGLSGFGLRNGSYDNTYPSIARIADAVAEVQPIALNAQGEEQANANVLRVLNHPNQEMCSTDFMEALAVMLLVHPKIYLLAWRKTGNTMEAGGEITEQNLAGLTFMEGVSERIINGKSSYTVNGRVFSDKEVLTLSLAVNPYRLNDGYSPSVASKKWATTDDYIAEYHNAQFRNNARPAGMLTIVADTAEEFNEAVDTIEAKFRGASNAGNTVYNMRPSQTFDGKTAPAKLEWTPFAQTNKDLTLEAVYNQANRKLESVFGVPDEVRGHLQNSNYASAEVADYIFSRRVVYPILVKIYSKLTHELNRITGGLGYALSFHYEVPMLTDTRKLQAEALKTMLDAGFSVESSVEALRLPESYKKLKREKKVDDKACGASGPAEATSGATATTRLRPKVRTTGGVRARRSAEMPRIVGQDERSRSVLRATQAESGEATKATNKDLGELPADKESLVAPNLLTAYGGITARATNLIIAELDDLLQEPEADLEDKLDLLENRLEQAFDSDEEIVKQRQTIQAELAETATAQINESCDNVGRQLNLKVAYDGEEIPQSVAELVRRDLYDSYRTTIYQLINATALTIYNSLEDDDPAEAVRAELEKLPEQNHWRAVRFGFSEQRLVLGFVAQAIWEWAAKAYRFRAYKIWHISPLSPAPCAECLKLNGEKVGLYEKFSNGKLYTPDHPNCYCYIEYVLEREDT